MSARTIEELIAHQAEAFGKAPALIAPDHRPLDYVALRTEVERMASDLAAAGIGRASRVGLALPNAPETVVAILSVLSAGVCVPLNPAFGWNTCETLLRSLRVDAVIAPEGVDAPAVMVARALDLGLLRLVPAANGATGSATLRVENARPAVVRTSASPDDFAIVFHTSGTTSTPKSVPLTHAQLVSRTHAQPLGSADRCLLVPPIFTAGVFAHSLLSPLASGAAIAFPRDSGLDALLDALAELNVTCFSANPALLESLRERAARRPAEPRTLRFIRSSASALTSEQQQRFEAAFGVPVLQAYGMTEAGTIAQNPLPPAPRKAGSVGVSVGPEIAILDPSGDFVGPDVAGEIVIRGPSTMSGYEDNPDANRAAFHEGWFRTGDSGHLDADGYLFITGRIKELINRGGMKVAPAEIDEALKRHPDVVDAIAFGVPHPTLGEDVAAAVVIRESATVSVQQLREFAFAHLAEHKVPSSIVRVTTLPRSGAGKVNRGAVANDLVDTLRPTYKPPRDSREELITEIIAEVLQVHRVGIEDNFFQLGGDSLRGAQVTARVNAATGVSLGPDALFRTPIVANYAATVAAEAESPIATAPITPRRRRGQTGDK